MIDVPGSVPLSAGRRAVLLLPRLLEPAEFRQAV
jgi:hypothetical protein